MKPFLPLLLLLGASTLVHAEPPLEVPDSADTRALRKVLTGQAMGAGFTCLAEIALGLKAQGMTNEQIAKQIQDPAQVEKWKLQCVCKDKAKWKGILSQVEAIFVRHPEWKGRALVVKGEPKSKLSETFEPNMRSMQEDLKKCP